MDGAAVRVRELLSVAVASRSAGDGDATRAAFVRAYDAARAAGDVGAMTDAAVGLARLQQFGTVPGQVPAFLYQAYVLASGAQRARVAVALARAWVYGGDAARATEFAREAIATAEQTDDAALLADALDAQLLVHWGPDDLAERLRITRRLEDTVVHLTDVEARMTAHLWRLTTAVESLDLPATQRQLRALKALADESGSTRVRFFAEARRGMYALLTGNLEAAARARDAAVAAGTAAGEADTLAIDRTLSAVLARQSGDVEALTTEASLYEEFAAAQGYPSIGAKGAVLWLAAGRPDRAEALLHQLAGEDFGGVPRDVDWLLTVTSLTEVAAGVGATDIAEAGVRLLEPYTGRGVLNAGATAFFGVVDDHLSRALATVGRADEAENRRAAAEAAYRRMGATWWVQRMSRPSPRVQGFAVLALYPAGDGVWTVGRPPGRSLADGKGLHYLRLLLGHPGVAISAPDLTAAVSGHPGRQPAGGNLGSVLDEKALAAYRRRLAELDEELEEARSWADPSRTSRLTDEREALLGQLREAVGLGGRRRLMADPAERARVAVRKAIAGAVTRIDTVDPVVGRLLRDTVSTGTSCRYDPDPGRRVRWILDPPRP